MPEGTTADARLERLLHILPAASREEGASLAELTRALGTTEGRIQQDLEQVTSRAYYHPGGWPDDVSILLEADRVRVLHASGFERPARLGERETLCLALALRGSAAAARLPDDAERTELLRRAETHLALGGYGKAERKKPGPAAVHEPTTVLAESAEPDAAGIHETLLAAARERHPCAIVYAKSGAHDVEVRMIHPFSLIYADGAWYVVGWCAMKEGMRVFRLDRILEAAEAEGSFQIPEDFDPARYVQANRVYRAEHDVEVRVRYSPKIARWVRERAAAGQVGWEEEQDGSVVIRHRVADPHWVVSHALSYGPDAEILEPVELREMVREVVERMG